VNFAALAVMSSTRAVYRAAKAAKAIRSRCNSLLAAQSFAIRSFNGGSFGYASMGSPLNGQVRPGSYIFNLPRN
jgi:hypothetical protein